MRKLSVTESQSIAQFFGTSSRRKCRTVSAEVVVGRVAAVVGHVSMHQSPQALDRMKVRAVTRNVMNPDLAPRSCQPFLNEQGMVVLGECDRAQGINRRRFDHAGCTRFQIDGAVNVEPLPPAGLFKRNLCVLWCPTAKRVITIMLAEEY